jgi:hypothetical protein
MKLRCSILALLVFKPRDLLHEYNMHFDDPGISLQVKENSVTNTALHEALHLY